MKNLHPHFILLVTFLVLGTQRTTRYPSLVQLLLEPGNLLQRFCLADHLLDPLPLLLGELDPDRFLAGGATFARRAGPGRRDVERAGSDAHDLGRERGRLLVCAKELFGLGTFRVLDLLVVEEADARDPPDDPVAVVLLLD